MSGNEFAILTQCAFSEGFKEGELYILEKIKAEILKPNTDEKESIMQIIDKYIEELNNEM